LSTVDLTGFRLSKSGKQRIFYTVECDVEMEELKAEKLYGPKEALPGITVKQVPSGFSIR
jgi:hypothetical protein